MENAMTKKKPSIILPIILAFVSAALIFFCAAGVHADELPENVYYYSGKPSYSEEWRGGLDASFEGMIMLGFHSKAGSTGCLLKAG